MSFIIQVIILNFTLFAVANGRICISECLADNLKEGSSISLCSVDSLRNQVCLLDPGEVVTCVLIMTLVACIFASFFSGLMVYLLCHPKRRKFFVL